MILLAAALTAIPAGTIESGGVPVDPQEMISSLAEADVVFIGETHDDPLAHEWELYIWQELASDSRALALEMFETDVQGLLNSYLAGEVSQEEFLAGSRPWGNYSSDYAPLVQTAIEKGAHVIAANVPRRFAAMVASGGWEALAEEDFFHELKVDSSSAFYRSRFLETMEMMGGAMHSMPMDPHNMYRAQLLKDAVMANSIRGISCFFVCGSFHSDNHSGILDQIDEDVSVLTVSVVPEGGENGRNLADFVISR
ncbi:hypothetical protein CSA37_05185 [Candidatus Fermentibacteria bacterium]|nr:MAG: hypothetical protein CSA37_05185 [Candidatus Fermentibacteria bacterium]